MRRLTVRFQHGATLVVAMILLLIITLVGVAGMQDTMMQEKMVANMRDRNLAFQAAEAALRGGERYLQSATLPAFTNSGGLLTALLSPYNPATVPYVQLRSGDPDFWNDFAWGSNSRAYTGSLQGVSATPRYVIEEVPTSYTVPGESMKFGVLKEIKSYRVTARATGGTPDAVVILQSTYRRQGGL